MKQKQITMILLPVSWIAAVLLRIWNLKAGYDSDGLPLTGHISTWCMAAILLVILIAFLLLALPLRRSSQVTELKLSGVLPFSALAGAALILASAISEYLTGTNTAVVAMLLLVLGLLAGASLLVIAVSRSRGAAAKRGLELLPILYLLIKLIINFKGWSIDPIILDYCIRLFAMICILLSFYYTAGFAFHIAAPARSWFFTAAGTLFAAAAAAEAVLSRSTPDLLFYEGCFLWMLALLPQLCSAAGQEAV